MTAEQRIAFYRATIAEIECAQRVLDKVLRFAEYPALKSDARNATRSLRVLGDNLDSEKRALEEKTPREPTRNAE